MSKQRKTILILGEGPTEFYYFQSLKDIFKNLNIQPDCPKHTNLHELERKIEKGVSDGYDHIFCIIDMDTKAKKPEHSQYARLKAKYAKPIAKPKKGINCEVMLFETHLCTELFFLYYFQYTSRQYLTQDALLQDINRFATYEKTNRFFIKCKGLHSYFERKGGNLPNAIANATRSIKEKSASGRTHTYSELGQLIERLYELQ